MRLDRLSVSNYRNIETAEFAPAPELTVLFGDNGQGKTNLLESVWMLTGGKSFRGGKDIELVRRGQEFAALEGKIFAGGREQQLRITVGMPKSSYPGRSAVLGGGSRQRASAIAGTFTAVVFDPGHLSLVKGSPEGRRRFLDAALCQLYPGYISVLRRYLRVVTQKNALLKKYDITRDAAQLFEVLCTEQAKYGAEITRRRTEYLGALAPVCAANYHDISRGAESLEIIYRPTCPNGQTGEQALLQKLFENKNAELRAGFCLAGPHREDFDVILSGQPAKIFASQGQQRSAVLSLKLAEAFCAEAVTGEHPVMLLDDVLSELDDARQKYLLTRMNGRQTIVTACDSAAFAKTNGKLLLVKAGTVREL